MIRDHPLLVLLLCPALTVPLGCRAAPSSSPPPPVGPARTAPADQEGWEDLEKRTLDDEDGLAECLEWAVRENAGLRAARERWSAARERVPQVASLDDPKLTWTQFIEEVETRTGPQEFRLELKQRLPWRNKLGLRGEHAALLALAERERYDAARLELDFEVKEGWFEHYFHERSLETVQRWRSLLEQRVDVLRTSYAAGDASYADLLRAQVELGRIQTREEMLVDHGRPIVARLNAAMNRPRDAFVPHPEELLDDAAVFEDEVLFGWMLMHSPELRRLSIEREAAGVALRLAKLERRPDFEVGVGYIDTGGARGAGVSGSGDDPVYAQLSINVPLRKRRYAAAEREARARQRAAALELQQHSERLKAELEDALFRVRNAERRIELHRDLLIPRAEQAYAAVKAAYRNGSADFLELVDAERTTFEFELELDWARTERMQLVAQLERLIGRSITGVMGSVEAERERKEAR